MLLESWFARCCCCVTVTLILILIVSYESDRQALLEQCLKHKSGPREPLIDGGVLRESAAKAVSLPGSAGALLKITHRWRVREWNRRRHQG